MRPPPSDPTTRGCIVALNLVSMVTFCVVEGEIADEEGEKALVLEQS